MATISSKPRRPWLAALLSLLFGPVGQVYVGRFRRGLVLWTLGALLLTSAVFGLISLPIGRIGVFLLLLCMVAYPACLAIDAFALAKRNRETTLKAYQKWWVYVLMIATFCILQNVAGLAARNTLAEAFSMPTRSMAPTITPGDLILVDRLWFRRDDLKRNDVVVFRSDGPGSILYVQRIVGLAGDNIEVIHEQLFVNGMPQSDHAFLDSDFPSPPELADFGPVQVPANTFFVMGDNRRLANDSRIRGPIPISDLYGIARLIYWSRERIFPDPQDTSQYVLGAIRWSRIGTRLD